MKSQHKCHFDTRFPSALFLLPFLLLSSLLAKAQLVAVLELQIGMLGDSGSGSDGTDPPLPPPPLLRTAAFSASPAFAAFGVPALGVAAAAAWSFGPPFSAGQPQLLLAPEPHAPLFGWAVAADSAAASSSVLVGSPLENASRGAAHLFRRGAADSWTLERRFEPPRSAGDDGILLFGWNVAVARDAAVIAQRGDNETAAAVFGVAFSEAADNWSVPLQLGNVLGTDVEDVLLALVAAPGNDGVLLALVSAVSSLGGSCPRAVHSFSGGVWTSDAPFPAFTDDAEDACPVALASAGPNSSSFALAFSDYVEVFYENGSSWSISVIDLVDWDAEVCSVAFSPPLLAVGSCDGRARLYSAPTTLADWELIQSDFGNIPMFQLSLAAPLLLAGTNSTNYSMGAAVGYAFAPVCGDGARLYPFEECDSIPFCSPLTCTCVSGYALSSNRSACVPHCGNGAIELQEDETCDDGNDADFDGCSSSCKVEEGFWCTDEPSVCTAILCGDGEIGPGEDCDDDNTANNDGCSENCTVECGWVCKGEPSKCVVCGNGTLELWEECDDGNTDCGDGCSSTCTIEFGWFCNNSTPTTCFPSVCGDHRVTSGESCDDAFDPANGDGCSSNCTVERGWICTTPSADSPSACSEVCGNGILTAHEQCDDGNSEGGDGCSASCLVEPSFTCYGEPSVCIVEICGDGITTPKEGCDDNNTDFDDGCAPDCTPELGYRCTGSPSVCTWISCDIAFVHIGTANCSCHGTPDGTLEVLAEGGSGAISYAVLPADYNRSLGISFSKNSTFSGLSAGEYRVIARDEENCFVNRTVNVVEPIGVSDIHVEVNATSCNNASDGSLEFSASFHGTNLEYALLPAHGAANLTFLDKGRWKGLAAGFYYVLVYNGLCDEKLGPYLISQPAAVVVNVTGILNASECNSDDGAVFITIAGGTPPHSVFLNGTLEESLDELRPGGYEITVEDARGCLSVPVEVSVGMPPECSLSVLEKIWSALGLVGVVIVTAVLVLLVGASITTAVLCVRRRRKLRVKYARNTILLENLDTYS